MSDISNQLISSSYNYVLQSDLTTGNVYRIGGSIPVDPKFLSGLTIFTSFKFSDGSEQNGYVLTSDALGNASWQISSNDVRVTGFSYTPNTFTIFDNSGNTFSTTINDVTGLTINGNLTITGNTSIYGLSAVTISATTYENLPIDIRVTGGTYSNGTAIFTNNTGGTFNVSGFYTGGTDVYVTGGTYSSGTATFTNNTGGTFNVTGFYTGSTDVFVTGVTYNNDNTLTFTNNTGGTFNVIFNQFTGITSNTISATTYQNLPTDIRVTGGTYSAGTATFTNNTGGTFNVTGFFTGATDVFVTGGTYSNGVATFTNNTGGTFNVTGFISADTFTTGFTYSNNIFTISQNQGQSPLTANISTMTGLTINGNLTVTGSSQLNGQISSLSFTGTTDRVIESDSSGNLSAARRIIPAYLTGGTATSLLDNTSNWSPTGVYTGTSITNTFQGQKHYNSSYFFEAVADNFWIRLGRV